MENIENKKQTIKDKSETSPVFKVSKTAFENQYVKSEETNWQIGTSHLSNGNIIKKNSKTFGSNRNKILVVLTAVFLLVFASGYALNKWFDRNSFASQKIERIQGTEKSVAIGISPDGEYLAHAISNAGKRSLNVLHLPSNSNLQLVPPSDVNYSGLTFSNDGNYIYYIQEIKNESALYKIPIIGGEGKKILANVSGKISFSTNGEQFVFGRKTAENETAIMIANVDGSQEHIVAQKKAPEFFSTFDLSWSPDGKLIAFVEGESKKDGKMQVAALNVENGEKIAFSDKKWLGTDGLKWLADGSGVLVAAFETREASQIWLLPFPSGEPYKITNDLNNYGSVGLTADGNTLLAGQFQLVSSIWLVNAGNRIAPKSIISGKHDDFIFVNLTEDNKVVFASSTGGSNRDIWTMDADGANRKQLTANMGENVHPTISPDNKYILFSSDRAAGTFNIWRMNLDGTNPVQITFGSGETLPVGSPDGKWVVYTSGGLNTPPIQRTIWKVSGEGGTPLQIIPNPSRRPVVSPDGKYIAFLYKENQSAPWKVAIAPLENGPPIKVLDLAIDSAIQWTPDGNAISFIKTIEGVSNVWNQPINGGLATQVTQFTTEQISHFNWSKDNNLICSRRYMARDALLISGFK